MMRLSVSTAIQSALLFICGVLGVISLARSHGKFEDQEVIYYVLMTVACFVLSPLFIYLSWKGQSAIDKFHRGLQNQNAEQRDAYLKDSQSVLLKVLLGCLFVIMMLAVINTFSR